MDCFTNENSPNKDNQKSHNQPLRSYSVDIPSKIDSKLQKTFKTRKALQEKLIAFEQKLKSSKFTF